MRKDMDKVLFECLRGDRGPQGWGRRNNIPIEDRPRFEGIRRPHQRRRWVSYNLSPLERWLSSQVGKNWDKTYSAFRRAIGKKSSHYHLCDLLEGMVYLDTYMKGLEVWHSALYCPDSTGAPRPVKESRWYRRCFYVHPVSKCLCQLEAVRLVSPSYPGIIQAREQRRRTYRWLSKRRLLKQVEGIWYDCKMVPWILDGGKDLIDRLAGKRLSRRESEDRYGQSVICIEKLQLGRKELRRFGLSNSLSP